MVLGWGTQSNAVITFIAVTSGFHIDLGAEWSVGEKSLVRK